MEEIGGLRPADTTHFKVLQWLYIIFLISLNLLHIVIYLHIIVLSTYLLLRRRLVDQVVE